MPPNGYDTLVQQTSIPFKEITPCLQTKSLLVFSWKLVAVTLGLGFGDCVTFVYVALRTSFLSLVEIFPFLWICHCLTLVCRAEGVAATIGLGCIFSLHIAFRLPFCLWLRLFPSSDSVVCFSSATQEGWQLSLFMFPSGCLFTFGWDFSLLVSLPLFISLVCCVERAWQRSLVSGVSLPPQGDDE